MAQSKGAGVMSEKVRPVKSIDVIGNKTISIATILSKIKTRVGQDYLQGVVSDDLKRLYNTGYFSDIRVDRELDGEGYRVKIFVEEKPIIEEITFTKTKQIKRKTLEKKLKSKVGKFLDNKVLRDDEKTLKEFYEKKGLTTAEIAAETFVDEVTNKASIHFVVREGQKIRIQDINIFGNDSYNDGKIGKVIKSKPKIWIIRSGYLQEDVLKEDMDRIVAFYEQNGYIDATATYEVDYLYKGNIDVDITIKEGRRYSVGDISISGNEILSDREIAKAMENISEGGVFSREKLSLDVSSIRTLYFDRGYIFARVNETTSLDPNSGEVAVSIDIEEGNLAYVERIKIEGNTRTKDNVIRRELKLFPGDRFDGEEIRKSKERLNQLGYFEDVTFDIEDTESNDRKDLVVQVKEAKTGTFSFGGGFSTVDRIVGFVELEQRNFDIANWPTFTGGGQQLQLRAETGSSRNNYRLSFTEPWMFGRPLSGGFDVYRSERDREDDTGYAYDENRTGGVLRLGKRFNDLYSGNVSYKLEEVEISNIESGVSAELRAEEGDNVISAIGVSVVRDTRNSYVNPTKGLIVRNTVDLAGSWLGGDQDFIRYQFNTSYFIPLIWDSVLQFRLRAGVVNDIADSTRVPIFERFFAGGARSIRGYDERDVGPLDTVTLDPIGGESLLVGNIEYTIPLIQYIKLAAFYDVGNVWADIDDFGSGDYKGGVGLGLRIKTPIGPINLDYGYPLDDVPTEPDKEGKFYFSVSRGF
ncbi:MAG: outer membrane protein assembly factor BamA [Candidatus Omnitrophica bacterium]|nr:outer membrane protein assembly factor BamA [Candidatus Omnitrophota bacterium]